MAASTEQPGEQSKLECRSFAILQYPF